MAAVERPRDDKRNERRQRILALTWRLIAREGMQAASMRAIAAEAGYANGALAYYFSGKDDLVRASYEYVFAQTAARIAGATAGRSGLAALEKLCDEVLPLDEEKLLEARIVLPFWTNAQHDRALAQIHEEGMVAWRAQMRRHLREAQKLGEIARATERKVAVQVEQLLAMLSGAQVLAVLSGTVHTAVMQKALLRGFFESLAR
ncbi:MAG: TetR/AcrR family transcriptional regulator [Polyangiales bacterium]